VRRGCRRSKRCAKNNVSPTGRPISYSPSEITEYGVTSALSPNPVRPDLIGAWLQPGALLPVASRVLPAEQVSHADF